MNRTKIVALVAAVALPLMADAVTGVASGVASGQMSPTSDVSGNRVKATGTTTPLTRMTMAITGNVFSKGGDGGYDENASGTVGPASNSVWYSNAGTYIATFSGNSLESAASANGFAVAGDSSSRFKIKGNTGTLTLSNTGSGLVDFDGAGIDAQDGASFTVGGTSATGITIGHSGIATGIVGTFSPPTDAGAGQTGHLYQGSGAPSNGNGANGDIYFRTDTPGTVNQRVYVKASGSWSGIL